MKFVYPEITEVFDVANGMYNSLIIENKRLFTDIILAIESCAYKKLKNEKRLIIDEDLCEIPG